MRKLNDILETITGQPSPSTTNFPPIPTRRPAGDVRKPGDILGKPQSTAANSSRPISDPRKRLGGDTRPDLNDTKRKAASPAVTRPPNGQPTPPLSAGPSKPPKKGSFAEIMARGKAAQTTLGQVGKIQHKKIEKGVMKKEREAEKEKRANNIRSGLDSKSKFQKQRPSQLSNQRPGQPPPLDGKNGTKQSNGKTAAEPEKKPKKAALATTGYSGTARPKPGGGAGKTGARPTTGGSSRFDRGRDHRGNLGSRYDRYESEDEEDEDDEIEEENYESDVSSDMEAAAFEVDEEEELAAKIARKEDAEALAEENRMKREKEEKKRRLAALAKKAAKPRY